jgi:hypothetical protein
MTEKPVNGQQSIHDRIHAEMFDSFDEELELEIDDDRLDALTNEFAGHGARETVDRGGCISRNYSACKANW